MLTLQPDDATEIGNDATYRVELHGPAVDTVSMPALNTSQK